MKLVILFGALICTMASGITLPDNFLSMTDSHQVIRVGSHALGEFITCLQRRYSYDPVIQALVHNDLESLANLQINHPDAEFPIVVPLDSPFAKGELTVRFTYVSIALLASYYNFLSGGGEDTACLVLVLEKQANPNTPLKAEFTARGGFDFGFVYNILVRLFTDFSFYGTVSAHCSPLALVVATSGLPLPTGDAGAKEVARILLEGGSKANYMAQVFQKDEKKPAHLLLESPLTAMSVNSRQPRILEMLFEAGASLNPRFFDGAKTRTLEDFTKEVAPELLKVIHKARRDRAKGTPHPYKKDHSK